MTRTVLRPRAASGGGLRRVPRTVGAEQRVETILDGAAVAVERVGSERLTTTEIAVHADVAVGSVYRYFPDRIAVLVALSARHQARLSDRFADAFHEPSTDLDAAIDAFFDAFAAHYRHEPSARSLGTGDGIDLGAGSARTSWGTVAAPVVDAFASQLGVPRALAFAGITTACSVTDALLQVAFRDHESGEPALLLHARAACHHAVRRALD